MTVRPGTHVIYEPGLIYRLRCRVHAQFGCHSNTPTKYCNIQQRLYCFGTIQLARFVNDLQTRTSRPSVATSLVPSFVCVAWGCQSRSLRINSCFAFTSSI